MRKVLATIVLLGSSIALLHCAGSPAAAGGDDPPKTAPDQNVVAVKEAGAPAPKPPTTPPFDAAAPPVDAAPADAARPPPPPDAAPPPPPETPGPACSALSECCGKLTNSTNGAACYLLTGKKNEYLCAGGFATFDCSNAGKTDTVGPNCAQLSACCNSNQWIAKDDPQCTAGIIGTPDWKSGNEDLCSSDLYYYQNDPYGDCL